MNKLKIHGVRDTPERSRVWGSRRALSAGTTPPPRGEGRSSVCGWFDESCQKEGGKKRGRGRRNKHEKARLIPFGSNWRKYCLIVENPWILRPFWREFEGWGRSLMRQRWGGLKLDRNIGIIVFIFRYTSYIGREGKKGNELIEYLS